MLDFPKTTEVGKFLSKETLMSKLNLSAALKQSLKDDVRRFTITHELSEKSLNIPIGKNVSAVFVIEVILKRKDIDYKIIEAVAKQNPHKLVFVLRHENYGQLALFYGKIYKTEWMSEERLSAQIAGLNFDEVWDGFVAQIALDGEWNSAVQIADQLAKQEQREKLLREIERLERKARSEQQPKRKFELVGRIGELRMKLEGL